jgi:hypothetical protein
MVVRRISAMDIVLVALAIAAFVLLLVPAALLPLLAGTVDGAEAIDQLDRSPRPEPRDETWASEKPIAA